MAATKHKSKQVAMAHRRRTGRKGPIRRAVAQVRGMGDYLVDSADRVAGKVLGMNPAVSPQQYHLAQAVLSGTARVTGMTKKVARELVEKTPAALRSQWSRKSNPEGAAAEMYENFHGAPSEEVLEVVEEEHYHGHLAGLGQLMELKVTTVSGYDCTLGFDYKDSGKHVVLASNEEGTQLYLTGGDQSLDLKKMKMNGDYEKDSMVIGELYFISYLTTKDFDKFKPIIYEHTHGENEDTGDIVSCPMLRYDLLNKRLYVDGGEYVIKKPLFETSRGIEK